MECCELLTKINEVGKKLEDVKNQTASDVAHTHPGMSPAEMVAEYTGHFIKFIQYRRALKKLLKAYDDRCPPGAVAQSIRENASQTWHYPPPVDEFWKKWVKNMKDDAQDLPPLLWGLFESGAWREAF